MAGSNVTAATKATPIPIANAGPVVENSSNRVKVIPRNVRPTVPADAAITLPMELRARLHRLIRARAVAEIIVIAADEENGVICSRSGDHPAEEHDRLGRDREAELGHSGQNRL